MSSTYVEVREAENGVGELGFQLNDCETNGIDIQSHYNTFPAKDHTYNKDPSFVDEDCLNKKTASEMKNNENELPKRIVRAHRNIKHKIIKPRNEENVIKTESEDVKKTSSSKTIGVKDPVPEPSEPLVVQHETKISSENNESSTISETVTPKRSNRKRKMEDTNEQNIKDVEKTVKSSKKKKSQVAAKKENEKPAEASPEKEGSSSSKKSKPETVITHRITKIPEAETTKKQIDETPKEKTKPVKNEEIESQGVPSGWTRKVVERKSGKTAGLCDVYIYSPDGIKFRSRPDVAAYLVKTKSKLRIEDFSFKRASLATPSPSVEKKSSKVEAKEPKREKEREKEKTSSGSSRKKTAKLKVKITSPKRSVSKTPTNKETPKSDGEVQAGSSESKRTVSSRKKRNT